MTLNSTDTTKTTGIEKSISKLLMLMGLGAVLIAMSLLVATDESILARRPIAAFWGWIGVAFCGLIFAVALWRIVAMPKILVSLSVSGIRDLRISKTEIPWNAIIEMREVAVKSSKFIGFNLAAGTYLELSPLAKMLTRLNKSYGADVFITSNDLKLNFEALSVLIHAYWRAHGPEKSKDGLSPTDVIRGA